MNQSIGKVGDFHFHPREEDMEEFRGAVKTMAPYTLTLCMLNWRQELDISDIGAARRRLGEFCGALARGGVPEKNLVLLMPVLGKNMTPLQLRKFVREIDDLPIVGFKLFPPGESTNSGYAPSTEHAMDLIAELRGTGLKLALHLEKPGVLAVDKERAAVEETLPRLMEAAGNKIGVVLEHATEKATLEYVFAHPNMCCTITPQALGLSREMLIPPSSKMDAAEYLQTYYSPLFCKPIIPSEENRQILSKAWLSGNSSQIISGTDTAPWAEESKRPGIGAKAGIDLGDMFWSYVAATGASEMKAAVLLRLYTQNGARCYGVDLAGMQDYVPAAAMNEKQKQMMVIRQAYLRSL